MKNYIYSDRNLEGYTCLCICNYIVLYTQKIYLGTINYQGHTSCYEAR